MEQQDEMLLRKCSICKIIIKPHSNFVKCKNQKYGIGYRCYDCKKRQSDKFSWNICFKDVPACYKRKHFENAYMPKKLEKYISDLKRELENSDEALHDFCCFSEFATGPTFYILLSKFYGKYDWFILKNSNIVRHALK